MLAKIAGWTVLTKMCLYDRLKYAKDEKEEPRQASQRE